MNRLLSANNPESGVVSYTYHPGGALKTRTDARNAVVTVALDTLKRVANKTYTGVMTPDMTYCYDGAVYRDGACVAGEATGSVKGHLTGYGSRIDAKDAAQNYTAIDALGRVTASVQKTPGLADARFSYTYFANGALQSVTYPSLRVVSYTLNDRGLTAGARGAATQYLVSAEYAPTGAPVLWKQAGSTFQESAAYNGKGQLVNKTVQKLNGATAGDVLFQQMLDYGTTANNGNVLSQTVSTGSNAFTQRYNYDFVNRLIMAEEDAVNPLGATCADKNARWCHRYGGDAFGNVWQEEATGDAPVLPANGPSWYNHSTTTAPVVNNQFKAVGYDLSGSGNQTEIQVNAPHLVADYDGENRLVRVRDTSNGNVTVSSNDYDGEGRRIRKTVGSTTTYYVYDAGGTLMAEYGGAASTAIGTQYVIADHWVRHARWWMVQAQWYPDRAWIMCRTAEN